MWRSAASGCGPPPAPLHGAAFYCTEAGNFYGRAHFATARTDKDSYILFYTLSGSGLIEQNDQRIELPAGSALLLNCRTPQSYCTAPGQDHWHHYWCIWTARALPISPRCCCRRGGFPPCRSAGWRCSPCLNRLPASGSMAPPPPRSRPAAAAQDAGADGAPAAGRGREPLQPHPD